MKKAAAIGFVLSLFWFPACKHQAHVQIPLTKVLLIGIDGATWEIMDRMIAEGRLPVFKKLVGGGVSAPLETLEPTVSLLPSGPQSLRANCPPVTGFLGLTASPDSR